MSLVDRDNPGQWADGSPRSQNNGFTHGFGEPISWVPMQRRADRRAISSKTVERQRDAGLLQVGAIQTMGRNRLAVFSIENAATGRKSADRRAAIRKGGI